MTAKTGAKMKLYRNTGTVALPTWTEVTEVGDVSISELSRSLAELKRRGSDFTKNLPGLINSIAIEFTLLHGLDSTTFTEIQQAFFNGTAEEWLIADGDVATTGTEGLRLPAIVEQFPWNQPLEDVSGHDIRLAVAYMEDGGSEVDPSWFTV